MNKPSSLTSTLGNALQTVRAVAWSFIGLRSRQGMNDDVTRANPLQIIAVAFVGVIIFVAALALFVRWVVS